MTDTDTLREALLYYAKDEHYDGGDVPGHIYVLDDHGRTARQALATLSKPARSNGALADRLRNSIEALGEAGIGSNVSMSYEFANDLLDALSKPEPAAVGEDFLSQLRRVNSERYEAWITTDQPIMLCEHCGRDQGSASEAGSTHCNAPFDRKEHSFNKPHPYLTHEVRADAGIMFDAVELGGEVGELLNVIKKLERDDRGWRGSRAAPEDFADECADVLICLDKLARRKGVDLAEATARKFNATSDKVGLPQRLPPHLA